MTDRIGLYDKILKAEQALDRNIQRIESIERTLSAIRIDEVTGPKIEASASASRQPPQADGRSRSAGREG